MNICIIIKPVKFVKINGGDLSVSGNMFLRMKKIGRGTMKYTSEKIAMNQATGKAAAGKSGASEVKLH